MYRGGGQRGSTIGKAGCLNKVADRAWFSLCGQTDSLHGIIRFWRKRERRRKRGGAMGTCYTTYLPYGRLVGYTTKWHL